MKFGVVHKVYNNIKFFILEQNCLWMKTFLHKVIQLTSFALTSFVCAFFTSASITLFFFSSILHVVAMNWRDGCEWKWTNSTKGSSVSMLFVFNFYLLLRFAYWMIPWQHYRKKIAENKKFITLNAENVFHRILERKYVVWQMVLVLGFVELLLII